MELAIPYGASLILRHSADGEIQGLDDFPDAHPPVKPVFYGFRVMVGMGLLMLAVSWFGAWRLRGGASARGHWLRVMVAMTFAGWVATLAGWYVTEIGRQPWLVYGVLRTAAAATGKAIPIGTSLTLVPDAVCRTDRRLHQRAVLHARGKPPRARRRESPWHLISQRRPAGCRWCS